MGILDSINEIVSHQAATKASAVKVYQGLVRRAAENKNKKSDTLETIKDILQSAGKSPGEFKRDVDSAKRRKVLEMLASTIDERQKQMKQNSINIHELRESRKLSLSKLEKDFSLALNKLQGERHDIHQLLEEASDAQNELKKEAVTI